MNVPDARARHRPAVTIDDLTVAYDRIPAVHHLSGTFGAGSLTAIVGPNGAGKSTLLKAVAGLMKPDQGRITVADGGAVGYLPQRADIERSFPISVWDLVALGLWREAGALRAIEGQRLAGIRDALHMVGLEGLSRRAIGTLSAGQFQRVLFARLIVQDSPVILLDEPFTSLDERTTSDLLKVVGKWHEDGRTVIAVLHEMEHVIAHFPHCLLMAREPVAWGVTREVLSPTNLDRARRLAHGFNELGDLHPGAWHAHSRAGSGP